MANDGQNGVKGVFLASTHAFANSAGGQQLCTQEFILALERAGFDLLKQEFKHENGLLVKIRRRVSNQPYRWQLPANLENDVVRNCRLAGARFVFLNVVDLAPLAKRIKRLDPELRVILLSHGLESVDYIHTLRTQRNGGLFAGLTRRQETRLARQLIEECRQRIYIDDVICLAPFEAEIEKWLGARRVLAIPRTIQEDCIDWNPIEGRVGFVGRLDHPPNLEGLWLVLERLAGLAPVGFEFRIVGKPESLGEKLASEFGFVSYLGSKSEDSLRAEACTWTAFVHPLFCYARGASTKLAVAIGWRIPIITTDAGSRGYEWDQGDLLRVETPSAFASELLRLAFDRKMQDTNQLQVDSIANTSVGAEVVARRLRDFLS